MAHGPRARAAADGGVQPTSPTTTSMPPTLGGATVTQVEHGMDMATEARCTIGTDTDTDLRLGSPDTA
ncbi:hypothetical protein GCM10009664_72590 [Kitasatospora gansuensis]